MKNITITISVEELNALTGSALKADRLYVSCKTAEESCRRKREELRRLQTKYESMKTMISDASASERPQTNETSVSAEADAVLLANETEGRVSGDERAEEVVAELLAYVSTRYPGDELDDGYIVECCNRITAALRKETSK